MNFFLAVLWTTLQNLPACVGFLIAVRTRRKNLALALASFTLGLALTALLMPYTNWQALGYASSPTSGIPNAVLYAVCGLPLVFYASSEVWWSNWLTDVVLGAVLGLLVAIGQVLFGWPIDVFRIPLHLIAMAVSGAIFLLVVRGLRNLPFEPFALSGMAAFTILISAIWIAAIKAF
jgi:hypothetical protein